YRSNVNDSQSYMSKNTVKQIRQILNTLSLIRNHSPESPEGFYDQSLLVSNNIPPFSERNYSLESTHNQHLPAFNITLLLLSRI
ncbi:21480_t:CDS:1, partial [Racocetra persica]